MADTKNDKNSNSPAERAQDRNKVSSHAERRAKAPQGNSPALRFPGFSEPWRISPLNHFAKKITKKNKDNSISNILSNSANLGVIPQCDYFDRDIANRENTDVYYVIEHGDFVYNPRKSVSAPYGPVNIYEGQEIGIISPLYLCFRVSGIEPTYLRTFFKGCSWHRFIYENGDSGVRHDRVSIKDDLFLQLPVSYPTKEEQCKITSLLLLLDERIATQRRLIDKLETLIKGIAESLTTNTPNTKIVDCLACHSSTLQENQVGSYGKYRVYGANGICGYTDLPDITDDSILIVKDGSGVGTVTYASGKYSAIGTSNYLTAKNGYLLKYIYYCLMFFNFAPYKTGMAIPHIYFKDYGKAKIYCPSIEEQGKIAAALSNIENKIEIERTILQQYTIQKQSLLQHLFI